MSRRFRYFLLLLLAVAPNALAQAARVPETVVRRNAPQGAVLVRIRPSKTSLARTMTVLLDFGAEPFLAPRTELTVLFFRPGAEEATARHQLQPLSKSGLFGTHFTPEQAGTYRMEFRERLSAWPKSKLLFDAPLLVEAIPAEDPDDPRAAGRAGSERLALDVAMETLGDQWDELTLLLRDPKARKDDALRLATSLQALASQVQGQVPRQRSAFRKEFDGYAALLELRLSRLPGLIPDRPRTRIEMEDIENTLCLKCHTKFRFNIAENLKDWPRFEPKDSKPVPEPRP